CGGAFAGLDKIVGKRIGKSAVGFGAEVRSKHSIEASELLGDVMPEDLLNFGLIPEFIGRLPVISAVHQLQREDLVQILTEPKSPPRKRFSRVAGRGRELSDDRQRPDAGTRAQTASHEREVEGGPLESRTLTIPGVKAIGAATVRVVLP